MLNIGDIVQLKSGGPKMVIETMSNTDTLYCVWSTKNGEVQGGSFIPAIVKKVAMSSKRR